MKEFIFPAAAILGGLYLLLRRPKFSIGYFSTQDEKAVITLMEGLKEKGYGYEVKYKPITMNKPGILIGGQTVNPFYMTLVRRGVLPYLREGVNPRVIVKNINGIWYLAGVSKEDTLEAVRNFLLSL